MCHHIARSVCWVNHNAPVASDEYTSKLGELKIDPLPRAEPSPFLKRRFIYLPTKSQDIIMRHRLIQKFLASLRLGDTALDAAAVRDPEGTWERFKAYKKTPHELPAEDPHEQ